MRFYGIEMKGKFVLQKVSSLPVFDAERDEGRVLYNTTDKKVYSGSDTEWVTVGTGAMEWNIVNGNVTAEEGMGYLVGTTGGARTVTLPASPEDGDSVGVKDYQGNAKTNNITINGNGNNVEGGASLVINIDNNGVLLVYAGAAGWVKVYEAYGYAVYA
jgi:hypothetical protein